MNNGISLAKIDCESSIDRAARDFEFAYALMQQNKEMEDFVNESLILASGNKYAINEMVIIHEAAAGDKIKAFFEKIKNFFKKIFDKLGATMNALFQEQKKYIEQYQYIITKCKWQCGDVSDVYDFFKGLPRIIECADKGEDAILGKNLDKYLKGDGATFTGEEGTYFIKLSTFNKAEDVTNQLNELKSNPPDMAKKKVELFKEFIDNSQYWNSLKNNGFTTQNDGNGNPSVDETFKTWFNGSSDTMTYSGDQIEGNFTTIINACYAGQSYMNKLEKIVSTVSNKMDASSKMMEDYMKQQREKVMAAVNKADEAAKNASKPEGSSLVKQTKDRLSEEEYKNASNKEDYEEIPNSSPKEYKKKNTETSEQPIEILRSSLSPQPQNKDGKATYIVKYTPNDGPKKGTEVTGEGDDANKAIDSLKSQLGSGYIIKENYTYRGYRNYFNEANLNSGSSSSTENKGSNWTGSGSNTVNSAGETNSRLSNLNTNKMDAKDVSGAASGIAKDAEDLLNLDINHRQTCVNAEVQISTAIAQSMFNAFKRVNKDCFDILKGHVQWYLSNPGAEKQSENLTTRTRNPDMNAGGNPVKHSTEKKEGGSTESEQTTPTPAPETSG